MEVSCSYTSTQLRNKPSKSVLTGPARVGPGRVGSGRFGPGWFITDIGSTSKNNNFLFDEPHSYNQYFMSYDVVLFSHMIVTGSFLLRSTRRRFASCLSPPLANDMFVIVPHSLFLKD